MRPTMRPTAHLPAHLPANLPANLNTDLAAHLPRRTLLASLLSLAAIAMTQLHSLAGERSRPAQCRRCGCAEDCQKVCRLVCEERTITTTQWGYACEEFCVPSPSCPGDRHCDDVCDDAPDEVCDKAADGSTKPKACSQPKRVTWTDWIPGSHAKIFTKKKLMKRTITKKVPSHKWVVEDLCAACRAP